MREASSNRSALLRFAAALPLVLATSACSYFGNESGALPPPPPPLEIEPPEIEMPPPRRPPPMGEERSSEQEYEAPVLTAPSPPETDPRRRK